MNFLHEFPPAEAEGFAELTLGRHVSELALHGILAVHTDLDAVRKRNKESAFVDLAIALDDVLDQNVEHLIITRVPQRSDVTLDRDEGEDWSAEMSDGLASQSAPPTSSVDNAAFAVFALEILADLVLTMEVIEDILADQGGDAVVTAVEEPFHFNFLPFKGHLVFF